MQMIRLGIMALAAVATSCATEPSDRLVLGDYSSDAVHLAENPSFELVSPLELRVQVETLGTDCSTGRETTLRTADGFAEVRPLHWEPATCSNRGARVYLHEAYVELPAPGTAFEVRVVALDLLSRDTLVFRWTR